MPWRIGTRTDCRRRASRSTVRQQQQLTAALTTTTLAAASLGTTTTGAPPLRPVAAGAMNRGSYGCRVFQMCVYLSIDLIANFLCDSVFWEEVIAISLVTITTDLIAITISITMNNRRVSMKTQQIAISIAAGPPQGLAGSMFKGEPLNYPLMAFLLFDIVLLIMSIVARLLGTA